MTEQPSSPPRAERAIRTSPRAERAIRTSPRAGRAIRRRPRRLRTSPAMRAMVAETSIAPRQLVLPVFVAEGLTEPRPISSMPGVVQHTLDTLRKAAVEAARAGLAGVMLFGIPQHKDARGSGAVDPDGILTRAIRAVRSEVGDDCLVMTDVCLDEFTDHGHCGVLTPSGAVDNDATVEIYAAMAVLHAEAGAHVVAPSGMMDGQVGAIRDALDAVGAVETTIMAYAAKYTSAFYGPFREAVDSSLQGDRKTYQQDGANVREALREVALDVAEGADIVMVKPALAYLDVLRAVAEAVDVPVAAYNISGEYAMVEAAAAQGWISREPAVDEVLTSIRRAGADIVLSYWAQEWAERHARSEGQGAWGPPRTRPVEGRRPEPFTGPRPGLRPTGPVEGHGRHP